MGAVTAWRKKPTRGCCRRKKSGVLRLEWRHFMAESISIPLFPLGLVLYPEERLPLHIFEPRYRDMIRACLTRE